jgi:hypothetical protein
MKAFAWALVAAIGLGMAPPAKADFWFEEPSFGAVPYRGAYHGGPYVVVGYGDDNYDGQRRYWGGPFWVECGYNPPFETYRKRCRPLAANIATRDYRRIKVRLK